MRATEWHERPWCTTAGLRVTSLWHPDVLILQPARDGNSFLPMGFRRFSTVFHLYLFHRHSPLTFWCWRGCEQCSSRGCARGASRAAKGWRAKGFVRFDGWQRKSFLPVWAFWVTAQFTTQLLPRLRESNSLRVFFFYKKSISDKVNQLRDIAITTGVLHPRDLESEL